MKQLLINNNMQITCARACVSVNVILTKNNRPINLKLEHVAVYLFQNSSEEFAFGHCLFKVKVTAQLQIYLYLPQYKLTVKSYISALVNGRSCDAVYVFT